MVSSIERHSGSKIEVNIYFSENDCFLWKLKMTIKFKHILNNKHKTYNKVSIQPKHMP